MRLLALLLCLASLSAAAQWKQHIVASGFLNQTVIAADFTGDGKPDVITNDYKRTLLFVAPNWQQVVLHSGLHAIHSAVMDVDADGDVDFIGTTYSPATVFWLERPANPLTAVWPFHLIDSTATGGVDGVHGLLAGDINGDRKPDLAATSGQPTGPFANSVVWFERSPNPKLPWIRHWAARGDAPGLNHYVGIGDVDGDGRADLATAGKDAPGGNWFAWWKQPAGDGPWKKTLLAENQQGATNILIADLNGDRKPDFAASRGHGKGVIWFEAPSWRLHEIDPAIAGPHSLAVADIDNDGDIDIATCAKDSRQAAWYENNGKGQFTRHLIGSEQSSYDVRLVDMDGDGDLDLLVCGEQSRNVVWHENPRR